MTPQPNFMYSATGRADTPPWQHGIMADSDALRSRRKRLHAKEDHHLCRHGPGGAAARLAAVPAGDDMPVDPRASLERLARALEAAYTADPGNGTLARELRMTLQALAGDDPDAGFDVG